MGIHLRGRLSDAAARRKEAIYKERISSRRVSPEEIREMQDALALHVQNKQKEVAPHGNGHLTEHHYRDILEDAHRDPHLSDLLTRAGLRSVSTWSLSPNHLAEIKIKALLEGGIIPPPDHGGDASQPPLLLASMNIDEAVDPTKPPPEKGVYEVSFDFTGKRVQPPVIPNIDKVEMIVAGDLHANFQKMLDHFIRVGAIQIPVPNDYAILLRNAHMIGAMIDDGRVRINPQAPRVLLLGDVFADRGGNDKAKLELLFQLTTKGYQFEMIWGNHDSAFLRHLSDPEEEPNVQPAHMSIVSDSKNPQLLIETRVKFQTVFERCCKLLVIHDGVLYSHAPINIEELDRLVEEGGSQRTIPFRAKIDAVNEYHQRAPILFTAPPETNYASNSVWTRVNGSRRAAGRWIPEVPEAGITTHVTGHDTYPRIIAGKGGVMSLDNSCGKMQGGQNREKIVIIQKKAVVPPLADES